MIQSQNRIRAVTLFAVMVALSLGCGVKVKVGEEQVIEQSEHQPGELEAAKASMWHFLHELEADRDTWDLLSDSVRDSTMKITWSAALKGQDALFGELVERESAQATFTDNLPDAPPGRYFLCDFDSAYTKSRARERVVLVLEDETWKVAGYFKNKKLLSSEDNENP